jgi:signal transduction histidine kinase
MRHEERRFFRREAGQSRTNRHKNPEDVMEMSDDVLLEELKKRFYDTRKALHDMMVMNEKIERLNIKLAESERLKSNFLSNIRNEINNPLTSILGMARELAGPLEDEQRRLLMARMVYHEAFELDFQLRNIFTAAELEAGEAVISPARMEIESFIRRAVNSFSHKAAEKHLTVTVACRPEADGKLLFTTDSEKLHLVIVNLLANAIEYNKDGKTVKIEARRESGFLHISVADEGKGIPGQELRRLFERFRQLDQGSSKKHKGHGLGLSITKALVELLGGKISAAEAAGGGALFQVVIPESTAAENGVFSGDGNEFLFEGGAAF